MIEKYGNWRKSTHSGSATPDCVEVAFAPGGEVAVRDTKDRQGAVLEFSAADWAAFVEGVRGS
ncbi:DUF397 domain-containing protein [Longispora albida]|uniref:DUF397 domain-containing protein n=1 Tax=Longispora albida TaxID=203523 RepID=UPI00036F4B10|nr:DUF397 domain-containing protein [Longispora albida]